MTREVVTRDFVSTVFRSRLLGVFHVMFHQKIKILIVVSAITSSMISAVDRLTADDSPTTVPPSTAQEQARDQLDQPPSRPVYPKPLAQGPNNFLVFRNGRLVLLDPDGKNERVLTADREAVHGEARLSPDGKWVASLIRSEVAGGAHQKLCVRAIGTKESGIDLGVECQTLISVLWSPDGAEIAFAEVAEKGGAGFVNLLVDVKTKEKKILRLPDGHLLTDWSRDGKLFLTMVYVADKAKPQSRWARLYLVNRDGTEHSSLTDEKQYCAFGRLSPEGTQVLYGRITPPGDGKAPAKRELVILDISTGKSTAVADIPVDGEVLSHCWSPDGKKIAYVWRQFLFDKWYEGASDMETESRLVICEPDGKNQKTIVSEKGPSPRRITLGWVDWR